MRRLLPFALAAVLAAPAAAGGRRLESMTWKEAEPVLKDAPVVLIPLGARTKEHGLHLPLNTDWLQAEYLTRRVLERADVVALPTLQYGYYPAFTEYPGSVSVGRDTFRDLVVDLCRSLSRYGPKKFYVLNTGISTSWALEPARAILARDGLVMEYTHDATDDVEKAIAKQEAGTHADEIETSVMLYVAPDVVKMERASKDVHPDKGPGGLTRNPDYASGVYSPTGAWGDPTLATREKGARVVETLIDRIVARLEKMKAKDYAATPPEPKYLSPRR